MAHRSSAGLAGSRIGPRLRLYTPALPCLQGAGPDDPAVPARLRPHEFAANVVTLLGLGALEAEDGPSVPAGARNGLGDGGERGVARSLPGEPVLQHHHLVGVLLPCADQLAAGF